MSKHRQHEDSSKESSNSPNNKVSPDTARDDDENERAGRETPEDKRQTARQTTAPGKARSQ